MKCRYSEKALIWPIFHSTHNLTLCTKYRLQNIKDSSMFSSIKPKRTIVFFYLCVYPFLSVFTFCEPKVVFHLQNKFRFATGKNRQELVNTQKSTNNRLSYFGWIEENVDVSLIHLAVLAKIGRLANFCCLLRKYELYFLISAKHK